MSGPVQHAGNAGRRQLLRRIAALGVAAGSVAGGALRTGAARASAAALPASHSLAQELALAQKLRQPLVVMVSLHGCPFCEVVRSSHLAPMLRREGLPVVQVDMRSKAMTEDFAGQPVSHDQLVRQWNARVAPTVLFFGQGAKEVAERLEGGYLPDFYGSYLDDRLLAARQRIRKT